MGRCALIVIAALLSIASPTSGQWIVRESVDEFTDEISQNVLAMSESGSNLLVSCDADLGVLLAMEVDQRGPNPGEPSTGVLRIDEDPAIEWSFITSSRGRTMLTGLAPGFGDGEHLLKSLLDGERLIVGTPDYQGVRQVKRFPLEGAREALTQLPCVREMLEEGGA